MKKTKTPIYKRVWFWFIIVIFGLFVIDIDEENRISNHQSTSKLEIPTFKIGWIKYYDYGKYIDYESLSKINFGDVVFSEIYSEKGTPCYGGYAWFYYNSNNEQIMVLYSSDDPYKIQKINYVENKRIWDRSPLFSNERIITIHRWKYEHYALYDDLKFDENIDNNENIIYEDETPNEYEVLKSKGFSNGIAEVLSSYDKKFYIEEASVSSAIRSNGEEFYSLYYGISTEMTITYYNSVINFYDKHSNRYIIKNNILIADYIFDKEVNDAKTYIEEVVKLKSIDYLKEPTKTNLDYFNKYTRLLNNQFKYSGNIGTETFEIYFKYEITENRWIFYKFILSGIDHSLI